MTQKGYVVVAEIRKACVIGWPILHSRSPLIHRFWLRHYGIEGDYLREAVAPDQLGPFVSELRAAGYSGANVTLPHKSNVLALCDRTTELARRIGAANTLWFENGQLWGDNSDVVGFLSNLDEQAPGWDANCEHAVILGAGGAARAILAGLAERKTPRVTILNRSVDRAQELKTFSEDWGFEEVNVFPLNPDGKALEGADLLVNTTSLGMSGQMQLCLDLSRLSDGAVVSDIVYTPLETELLIGARKRGLRAASGLGMLLYQAVPGFTHWFGVQPEVTKQLRSMIEADIQRGRL